MSIREERNIFFDFHYSRIMHTHACTHVRGIPPDSRGKPSDGILRGKNDYSCGARCSGDGHPISATVILYNDRVRVFNVFIKNFLKFS